MVKWYHARWEWAKDHPAGPKGGNNRAPKGAHVTNEVPLSPHLDTIRTVVYN
jgi:hypothetical protein